MATLEERVRALENLLSLTSGTDLYNSTHTGPEIDNAVTRALPGGALDVGKADKAVQTVVQATGHTASQQEYTVTADNLNQFLKTLPRLLTYDVRITVTGTTTNMISIPNFYGTGGIIITAPSLGDCTLQQVYVVNCKCNINLWNLKMVAPTGLAVNTPFCSINSCKYVRIVNCAIEGYASTESVRGIEAVYGSNVTCENCSISKFKAAVLCMRGSRIDMIGGSYSDNEIGAYVTYGGIIMIGNGISETLGGSSNAKGGGLIFKGDGTLL